jgi:hypothetical protein
MNGDVLSGGLKKLGQTRPPIRSSSFAAVSSPTSLDRKKRNTPLQTGQTGRRANFSFDFTVRGLGDDKSASEEGAEVSAGAGDEKNLHVLVALGDRITTEDDGAKNASQRVKDRDANTIMNALIACYANPIQYDRSSQPVE